LNFRKADLAGLREFYSKQDWELLLSGKSVEEMWIMFKSVVNEGCDKFVPRSAARKRKNAYMTQSALRACRRKYSFWRRYRLTRDYDDYVAYKRVVNEATSEVRRAKRSFEKKLAENIRKDSKSFYAYA
jgi:hypothetical protein